MLYHFFASYLMSPQTLHANMWRSVKCSLFEGWMGDTPYIISFDGRPELALGYPVIMHFTACVTEMLVLIWTSCAFLMCWSSKIGLIPGSYPTTITRLRGPMLWIYFVWYSGVSSQVYSGVLIKLIHLLVS